MVIAATSATKVRRDGSSMDIAFSLLERRLNGWAQPKQFKTRANPEKSPYSGSGRPATKWECANGREIFPIKVRGNPKRETAKTFSCDRRCSTGAL
jgi:hypothetical protein